MPGPRLQRAATVRPDLIQPRIQNRPLWHPPPAPVHTVSLPLLLCLKPAISHHLQNIAVTSTELPAESWSVVVTFRKSSHGRPVFQPALNWLYESSPVFPPFSLSLCTAMVLSAWDEAGPLRTARESSCRRTSSMTLLGVTLGSNGLGCAPGALFFADDLAPAWDLP